MNQTNHPLAPLRLGLKRVLQPGATTPVTQQAKLTPASYARYLSSPRVEVLVGTGANRESFSLPAGLLRWISPFLDRACNEAEEGGEVTNPGRSTTRSTEDVRDNFQLSEQSSLEAIRETQEKFNLANFHELSRLYGITIRREDANYIDNRPMQEHRGRVVSGEDQSLEGSASESSNAQGGAANHHKQSEESVEATETHPKGQAQVSYGRILLPDQSTNAFHYVVALILRPDHTFVPILSYEASADPVEVIQNLVHLARLGQKLDVPMFDQSAALNIQYLLESCEVDMLEAEHIITCLEALDTNSATRKVVMEAASEAFEQMPWEANRDLETDWKFGSVVKLFPTFCQELLLSGRMYGWEEVV